MTTEWKPVAEEDARQRKLYGFGGWMWLLYALLLYRVWVKLSMVFRVPQWDLELIYETAAQARIIEIYAFVEILLWMPFLVLAPLGHRLLPPLAIAGFLIWWILTVAIMTLVIDIAVQKAVIAIGLSTVITAIFVAYLLRSRRVNLTCRLQERVTS